MKTIISKGFHGWTAESMSETDHNGEAWQISTSKSRDGVSCTAIKGQHAGGMFSYEMFGAKRLNLAASPGQCTEKKVKEVHADGLKEFERIMKEEEPSAPAYIVKVGQIIFTDGYDDQHRRVIYEISSHGQYKTATLDGKFLRNENRIKNYSEKYGIGVYYIEGDTMEEAEALQLAEAAKAATEKRNNQQQANEAKAAEDKAQKIEEGKSIINSIPEDAKYIIIANLHKDESDIQSDYHGHSVEKTVYLSFSSHGRDLFPELRKAAAKFEETKHLATAPERPEGDAGKYWTAEDEHREKYSMGAGYYLGAYKNSNGWTVKKASLPSVETLQIAAAEGRFLCSDEETEAETVNIEPVEVKAGSVQIIEYGEGLAVIGDTRPIKDKLKAIGGRFNFRLTCGPGWVFKKSQIDSIIKCLGQAKPEPDTLQDEINKTVEFFEDTDKKIFGEVTEQTEQIKDIQQPKKETNFNFLQLAMF